MIPTLFRTPYRLLHHETYYTKKLVRILKDRIPGFWYRVEGLTTINGHPDIIGCLNGGRIAYVEVKKESEPLTMMQKRFMASAMLTTKNAALIYIARIRRWQDGAVEAMLHLVENECLDTRTGTMIRLGKEKILK